MRQPRRTDRYRPANLASASLPSWLDEETGRLDELEDPNMVELEPINIQGDPNAPEVVELAPFDIAGDVDAPPRRVGDYAPAPAGTRAPEEPKPMNGDWLSIVDVLGDTTEDERTGLGGYEIPEWAARVIANDDGTMPTGALEAIGNLIDPAMVGGNMAGNIATQAALNASRDVRIAPEDRTVLAAPAVAGLANAGSLGFADDIAALLPEEVTSSAGISSSGDTLRDQMRGGFDWAQREAPGSFAIGEDAAIAAQMAVPGAPLRAGASPTARALATGAEGALMGGLEGFGRSDAETVGGRLRDAVPSAVAGGVLSGGLGALAGRAQRSADTPVSDDDIRRAGQLRDDAAWDWLSQAGANQSSAKQRMLTTGTDEAAMTDQARWMVDTLRDRGIIPPEGGYGPFLGRFRPPDQDAMLRDIARLGDQGQAGIQRVAEAMSDEGVPVAPIVDRLRGAGDDISTPFTRAQGAQIGRWADDVSAQGRPSLDAEGWAVEDTIPFSELQRWKTQVGRQGNYDPTMASAQGAAYRTVTDSMNDAVAARAPELGTDYRTARENSLLGLRFEGMGAGESRRAGRNRTTSPSDYLAGGAAAGTIGPILAAASGASGPTSALASVGAAVAAIGVNKWHRATEHGRRAMGLERQAMALMERPEVAQRWASVLTEAQRRGPRAIAAALYLIQQRDPQARQAMQAEDEAPETQDMPEMQPEQPAPIEDVENVDLDDLFAEEPITDVENVDLEDLFQ